MNDAWLTGYIDAWSGHYRVSGPEGEVHLARLVAFMAHDVEYEDVPSGLVFVGHDGIRDMANAAARWPRTCRSRSVLASRAMARSRSRP